MKIFLLIIVSSVFIYCSKAQVSSNEMVGLAQIRKGIKSKRVSSFDTTGGNTNARIKTIGKLLLEKVGK